MKCPNPNFVWPKGRVIAVPCGKCLACLSNKRYDWSCRIMEEQKVSSSAMFVTLTYSEKYLPNCGVVKRHLQLFFKRLRKKCPKIRYYAVGEYGSITRRPHYHIILFNGNENAVRSEWTLFNKVRNRREPIGIVHIGQVTEASVQYCTKYVIQKNDFPEGLNPSFALMSRGYGLGLSYLSDAMVAWHRNADRLYMVKYGQKLRLPRYYKEKIWPNSTWSDWAYRREETFKKGRMEADKKERENLEALKNEGVKNPEQFVESTRRALLARVKSKTSFTQHL